MLQLYKSISECAGASAIYNINIMLKPVSMLAPISIPFYFPIV